MESSGPEVNAMLPDEKMTPVGSPRYSRHSVPEAGATSSSLPATGPSSADAARSIPERDERADERVDRSDTDTG